MGIELSSSEVCSRVQLGNAFVFITTIVLQSQPISYNLLLHGDGKQLAIFLLVIIFLVQIHTHSVLFSMLKNPNSLFLSCCGFSLDFSICLKMQRPTLSSFKWPCSFWGILKNSSQSLPLMVSTTGLVSILVLSGLQVISMTRKPH